MSSGNPEKEPITSGTTLGSMTTAGTAGAAAGGGKGDLERLIRLFTDEDTADLVGRQLVVLRRVCKVRTGG